MSRHPTGAAPRPRSFACLRNSTKTSRDRRSNQVEKWERRERGRKEARKQKCEYEVQSRSRRLGTILTPDRVRRIRDVVLSVARHRKELRSKTLMAKLSSVFRPSSLFSLPPPGCWDPFSVSLRQRECCSRAPHPIDIAVALPRRFFAVASGEADKDFRGIYRTITDTRRKREKRREG